jgi:stage II sporulation protein P
MKSLPERSRNVSSGESVCLQGTYRRHFGAFAVLLVGCALLIAAFGISSVWKNAGADWFSKEQSGEPDTEEESTMSADTEQQDPPSIPQGATAVKTMDLSYLALGKSYLHNETLYSPSIDATTLTYPILTEVEDGAPVVLVLHTHSSEGYLPQGCQCVEGSIGDATYTKEKSQNVIAVGRALVEVLNEKGITALHCTVMHDDPSLQGAYSRAKETIQYYLKSYPTIQCVIDLHRDAVTTAQGDYVRSLASGVPEPTAQILAVVGTDGNGTPCPQWQANLALALRLREYLNENGRGLSRPISLRNASYNQEMAPISLLLEIGTGGNSSEEAIRAARWVGEALAAILTNKS